MFPLSHFARMGLRLQPHVFKRVFTHHGREAINLHSGRTHSLWSRKIENLVGKWSQMSMLVHRGELQAVAASDKCTAIVQLHGLVG